MARTKAKGLEFDYGFSTENIDVGKFIEKFGIERVIEVFGAKNFFKKMEADWLLAHLSPEQLKKIKDRLR